MEDEVQEALAHKRRRLFFGVGVVPAEALAPRSFIAMTQTGEGSAGKWKERTVYRFAARRWVCNLDNQIARSTVFNGLVIPNDNQGQWENRNWRVWPGVGVARDCGSDGNTGFHALLHHYKINGWDSSDNNHCNQRSFDGGLRDFGLWEMWLSLLISWNLPWGPSDDEYRRNQLDEAMKHFYAINTEESPLFQNLCVEVAQDLEEAGIVTFPRERPLEE